MGSGRSPGLSSRELHAPRLPVDRAHGDSCTHPAVYNIRRWPYRHFIRHHRSLACSQLVALSAGYKWERGQRLVCFRRAVVHSISPRQGDAPYLYNPPLPGVPNTTAVHIQWLIPFDYSVPITGYEIIIDPDVASNRSGCEPSNLRTHTNSHRPREHSNPGRPACYFLFRAPRDDSSGADWV